MVLVVPHHCNYVIVHLNFFATGDRPTMRNLKKFPSKHGQDINIPLQIGKDYRTFGTFLLEDDSGTIVSGIEMATDDVGCRKDQRSHFDAVDWWKREAATHLGYAGDLFARFRVENAC